jgi:hypothetical protein
MEPLSIAASSSSPNSRGMQRAAALWLIARALHPHRLTGGRPRLDCPSPRSATAGSLSGYTGSEGFLDDVELLNAKRFPDPATVRIDWA